MKIEVPFYRQEARNDCAPTALKMVLDFLGSSKYSKEELLNLVDSDKSGVTWTIALAKTAAQLGFRTEFYSSMLGFNPQNYQLDFYKKEADTANSVQQKLEKLKGEAVKFKVHLEEKRLQLKDILDKINPDCVAIVLLDWSKIKGTKEGFIGHTVPIVGYDEENVYVHNQGDINPGEFIPIKKELFDIARKSPGTDEDIVFVHRKI